MHTVNATPSAITAFIGTAQRGPSNHPRRVRSFAEFEQLFGGLVADLELGYAVQQFFLNGGTDAWVVQINRRFTTAQIIKGIHALDKVDLVNLLAIPGCSAREVIAAASEYCVKRRAFLIVDSPRDIPTAAKMEHALASGAIPRPPNAAVYFPWIHIADPLRNNELRSSPPSGSVTGMIARTDATRGVWKAPAGVEATLRGAQSLTREISDAENGVLNPLGVNCLRRMQNGVVVWGARTLAGADQLASEWKYVPVRRMALFLEQSIERDLQWAVFEPNDEPLWAAIRLSVGTFLNELFRAGAFQGRTPREAYFVKCNRETITQQDLDSGSINVLVGFAALKPAEFVVLKIRIKAAAPRE